MSTTHKLAKWLEAAVQQTKRAATAIEQKYGADAAAPMMKEHGEITKFQAELNANKSTPLEEYIKTLKK